MVDLRRYIRGEGRVTMLVMLVLLTMGAWGCANIGSPEGGPYDVTPPRLVKANPINGAVGVRGHQLTLHFDEYIKLSGQDKVVISPPQQTPPRITAIGKEVTIRLEDTLRPATTYSIYFGDALADNNEDNPIEDFHYTFSTGTHIDSMRLSGYVVDARTLDPVTDLVVGAYHTSEMTDTTFRTRPLSFASKVDEAGHFTMRGLPDSTYTVFALKDDDRNYRYSLPTEGIAFDLDSYKTTLLDSLRTDTIKIDSIVRRDTLHRDSLVTRPYIYYRPDTLLLRYFVAESRARGIDRYERADSLVCSVTFLEHLDSLPHLRSLDKPTSTRDELYWATSDGQKVDYWLRDRDLVLKDSIRFELRHTKTDSLLCPVVSVDTLTFYKPQVHSGKKEIPKSHLELTFAGASGIYASTPGDSLVLWSSQPIDELPAERVHLEEARDSVYEPIEFALRQDSVQRLRYWLDFPRHYGARYRASIDSAGVRSIYGLVCDSAHIDQMVQPESALGRLEVEIRGLDSLVRVELLNKSGTVLCERSAELAGRGDSVRPESPVASDSILRQYLPQQEASAKISSQKLCRVTFSDLKPDDYYLRLYIDANSDGKWTTGDYPHRQPERVFYAPMTFAVKKGFTTAEVWDVWATPLMAQKPQDLRKASQGNSANAKKREDKNVAYYKQHKKEAERKARREAKAAAKANKQASTK